MKKLKITVTHMTQICQFGASLFQKYGASSMNVCRLASDELKKIEL